MPLFSIIIPVYNCEKFIEKCLKSALNQNFNNYEILIINDCTKDKSLKICKKYKKKYPKIKIINQKNNKGVSSCRNLGIKSSKGDYIIFLDSDDYIENYSLEKISRFIKKNRNADLIIASHSNNLDYRHVSSDGKFKDKNIEKKYDSDSAVKLINKMPNFVGYCWRFIVKKEFAQNYKIFFINARQFEDEEFVCKLLMYSKSIVFYYGKYYFHRSSDNSRLSVSINFNSVRSCIIVLEGLLKLSILESISREKKAYCKSRIERILKYLYPLLFFISENDLNKLSRYIDKKIDFFILIKKYIKKNTLAAVLNKKNKNYLLECRKIIEKNTLIKLRNLNDKKFYLFCMDRNGFAMAKILRRNNFKVLGFLDNNINLKGSGKFNIRFVPMKGALYKIKTNNNYYIIVCNQRSEQVTDIITQLKKAGISKKRILIKNFTLNLNEKIKLIS